MESEISSAFSVAILLQIWNWSVISVIFVVIIIIKLEFYCGIL